MHALQNTMQLLINILNRLFRRRAPSQKHHALRPLLVHNINHLGRELLPALARVALGLVRLNS